MNAFSGTLVSLDVIGEMTPPDDARGLRIARLVRDGLTQLGPAGGARQLFDRLAHPLFKGLGFDVRIVEDGPTGIAAIAGAGADAAVIGVGAWGADLLRLRSATCTVSVTPSVPDPCPSVSIRGGSLRWWIGLNGLRLRIVDLTRTYARRVADVDLERLASDEAAAGALAALIAPGGGGGLPALDHAVGASDRHRANVGRSLQAGVEQALGQLVSGFAAGTRRDAAMDRAFADALTVIYRILFLLFAEARGLVPRWHPVYRDSYTIESLIESRLFRASDLFRLKAEATRSTSQATRSTSQHSRRSTSQGSRSFRLQAEGHIGLWESLQAISRLAHRGCRAGTLRVTPFNGRLFAPASAPLADTFRIDDRIIREVLLAITTRPAGDRRARISYADLGVEHLGAVYERVLDFTPVRRDGALTLASTGRRKATGTFYTPRSMTEYLVRRTLAPLVRGRTPDQVLALRVLDPAMGSGAFLVAACRYLADAYEQALVREGSITESDIGPSERAAFRRAVAQRCLYGVDLNPTAVQLARLSLWLCTLAADRPLTFFDHHLRAGNSLVGASPADVFRQPPGRGRARAAALPLFDADDLHGRLASVVVPRLALAAQPDDTAAIVRAKERTLAVLDGRDGPLATWRTVADAWCAAWFWTDGAVPWAALDACVRGRPSGMPAASEARWRGAIADISTRERFFHWELEFPEVFYEAGGTPRTNAGFDAVIGNPPWDTLRADPGARPLTAFTRESGCYRLQSDGHANLYHVFAERALRLVASAGRLGLVMPAGLIADHGCARLREALFERCRVDGLLGFDNREAIFPIHRGMRFVLLTATAHQPADAIRARFALRSAASLDDIPDEGPIPEAAVLPTTLLRRWSGPGLAVPELAGPRDREIVARVLDSAPALADEEWGGIHFGRELNATDDRDHFGSNGMPVLEGKLIAPFHVHMDRVRRRIDPSAARRLLGPRAAITRARLGYREVAASTNRLTLIAAMIPAHTVTTHTIFVLKTALDEESQWFLCGMFNSFVANYLVRLRGGTHVTAATMDLLRVPKPARTDPALTQVAARARDLAGNSADTNAYVNLQVRAAQLYRLSANEFAHVLATFPLVDASLRAACERLATSALL
ncbi:MAG: N-6 DNA methylase [Acidobacteria bacterium]|nr:N-6 DNA methylase [Acidobacteriota bacterium]